MQGQRLKLISRTTPEPTMSGPARRSQVLARNLACLTHVAGVRRFACEPGVSLALQSQLRNRRSAQGRIRTIVDQAGCGQKRSVATDRHLADWSA